MDSNAVPAIPVRPGQPCLRFGVFELDPAAGELRRKGSRVKLHAQPFQILVLLLEQPGAMLTRERICRELWPEGTFVDYEHGVNSAINRLREALGDQAKNPRYVETIARRGYRFLVPVERIPASGEQPRGESLPGRESTPDRVASSDSAAQKSDKASLPKSLLDRVLAGPDDLPHTSYIVVRNLFLLFQIMYVGFYIGALANLAEIMDLLDALPHSTFLLSLTLISAASLIPVRLFLFCAVLFRPPGFPARFRRIWLFLLVADMLWALAPFLLLHHISFGLALGCTTLLVYAPFAQRSLMLMGAGQMSASSSRERPDTG